MHVFRRFIAVVCVALGLVVWATGLAGALVPAGSRGPTPVGNTVGSAYSGPPDLVMVANQGLPRLRLTVVVT